jgi:hypothetical protein
MNLKTVKRFDIYLFVDAKTEERNTRQKRLSKSALEQLGNAALRQCAVCEMTTSDHHLPETSNLGRGLKNFSITEHKTGEQPRGLPLEIQIML